MSVPAGGPGAGDAAAVVIGNEFAEVVVDKVTGRNGVRLRIRSARTGREVRLCPLQLEALTAQPPDRFSELVAEAVPGDAAAPAEGR